MERPTKRQRCDSHENNDDLSNSVFGPAATAVSMTAGEFSIPTIHRCDIDSSSSIVGEAIIKAFQKYQALYFPRFSMDSDFQWKNLSRVFETLDESDKRSMTWENNKDAKDSGYKFLKDSTSNVGYCSFTIQKDNDLSRLLEKLPVRDPVTEATNFTDNDCKTDDHRWEYEPCLWIFFGRNDSIEGKDLRGRPEHTDQISHDGTWHYQLSGTKRWLLRPTPQLLRSWKRDGDKTSDEENGESNTNRDGILDIVNAKKAEEETDAEPKQIRIDCQKGDILVLNTKLWLHQTILPPQKYPSVSYARDFWIHKNNAKVKDTNGGSNAGAMTNVDGLYAIDDIAAETIIFREDDMPDCELHRTKETEKANCKVVELEDGMQAVVSSKFISAGEFFCIPESSDEEDIDDDNEDLEEWSGEEDE